MPAFALALLLTALRSAGAAEVTLSRDRAAGAYHVTGRFQAAASAADAWDVITDYDGIARFVPSIVSSRVLRRKPDGAVIEQEVLGRYLFFSRRIKLTLAVKEEPPRRVAFRQIGPAPFLRYAGAWTISGSSAACSVSYRLTVSPAPGFWPELVERSVLRKEARQLLERVRDEIERRSRAAPKEPPPR